jgi:hypothetical protein
MFSADGRLLNGYFCTQLLAYCLKLSSNLTDQAVASYGIGALTEMCGRVYLFGNKLVRNYKLALIVLKTIQTKGSK